MILKKITIQNIASIENAVVDFTQSPLQNADLFLIHGETGSGKTTIIDAICLALFNNTPRLKSAPTSVLKFGNYQLSSRNTANMLRHGATNAKAELVFVGNDDQEYTAVWTAHATPNNINTTHLLFLNGNQIAGGAQVIPLMRDTILGMTFDDFCRTAVLAQGEFTKFLKCNDDEKAAILEKLTATEQFSEVGKAIYAIWKSKDDEYKKLQQQMEGIKLLTPEEIKAINEAISNANNKVKDIDSKIDSLTKHKTWLQQKATLTQAYNDAVAQHQQVDTLCKDPNYVAETKLLADYDLSQQAVADLKSLLDNQAKAREADKKEKDLATQFAHASAGLAALHADLTTKESELTGLDSMIDGQKVHKDMFDKSTAALNLLQQVTKKAAAHVKENDKIEDLEKNKVPACEKSLKDAQTAQAKAQKEVNDKTLEINTKKQEIAALNPDAITQRNEALQQLSDNLNQAAQSLQKLDTAIKDVEGTETRINTLQQEITDSTPKLEELRKALEKAQESYNQAENAYRSIDLASKEWAIQARAILHDGDVCPLCGNVYDASHFDQVVTQVKDKEADKLQTAKEQKENAEKDFNTLNASLTQKGKDADSLKKNDLVGQQNALKSAFSQASADCQKVDITLPDASRTSYEQALEQGQQKRDELKSQQEANGKDLNTLNALNQEFQRLNNQLSTLNTALTTATQTVNNAQKALDDRHKEIETANNNAQTYLKEAGEALFSANSIITWPNWQEEWDADSAAFEQRLKEAANDYRKAIDKQSRLKPQVTELKAQLQTYDSQRNALAQAWPQWIVLPADAQFSDNQAQRWNTLTNDAAAVRQQKTAALGEINDAEKALKAFYAAHPAIDLARLTLLKDFQAATIRNKHQEQDGKLAKLKGAVDTSKQNLDNHIQAQPANLNPTKDVTALEQEITVLGEQKKTLSEAIGANRQQLATDKANNVLHGKKQAELDAQKVIFDKWTRFNKAYGDTDGSKFRRLAQQLIFDRLLQLANQHLARLTARYSLKTIPGTLTISLCDQYTPGYSSSVHNLSGGESFMVSLSLALALSSMGREGISMDTLFIDEGFGTLSTENQIHVMDLLQTLQRTQGKRVGIISHVPYLRERIPVQVIVSRCPDDNTKSTLRTTTATT